MSFFFESAISNLLEVLRWKKQPALKFEMPSALLPSRLLWRAFGNLKLVSGYLRVGGNASVYRIYSNTNAYFPSCLTTSKISHHCSSFNSGISRMHAVWSLQWFAFIIGIVVVWETECSKVISILYQEVS